MKFVEFWCQKSIAALPIRTKENYAIHYCRLDDGDVKKYDTQSVLKASVMLVDVTLENDPPDGFIAMIDMSPIGIFHFTKLRYDLIKKYFSFIQEGQPLKLIAIHVMNSNFFMNKLFTIVKKCIKNDVFDKIHFHPSNVDLQTVYQHIPKKCLTKEFEGDLPSLKELSEITKQQFKNRLEYWDKEEQLRKQYQ